MGLNLGALLWSCEEGRDSLIFLGLGRQLAAEVLRRERPAGQEASARASSQSQFTEPAVVLQQLWGGDVAATTKDNQGHPQPDPHHPGCHEKVCLGVCDCGF